MPGLGGPRAVGARQQVRPGGGMRQTFGGFSDEHEESGAVAAAAAQKSAAQQSSILGQSGVSKQQAAAAGAGQTPLATPETKQQQAPPPRNVSNIGEELLARPAKDILNTFKSFFNLNALLGINPGDTPEKKAKKQKVAQNWQKLTQEEQAYVQQQYQEQQQRKQREAQEEEERKRQQVEQEQSQIAPPSTPKRGPVGLGGNKKQQASQLMQKQRTQMSQADG